MRRPVRPARSRNRRDPSQRQLAMLLPGGRHSAGIGPSVPHPLPPFFSCQALWITTARAASELAGAAITADPAAAPSSFDGASRDADAWEWNAQPQPPPSSSSSSSSPPPVTLEVAPGLFMPLKDVRGSEGSTHRGVDGRRVSTVVRDGMKGEGRNGRVEMWTTTSRFTVKQKNAGSRT